MGDDRVSVGVPNLM